MTKQMDMSTFRPNSKGRKAPTYTPREMLALKAADRIVGRLRIAGEWKEMEFWPMAGQTVRSKLAEVQAEIAADPACARICLYVGAVVNGERMIANVPHNLIPAELEG